MISAHFVAMARKDQQFLNNVLAAFPPGSDDYAPFPGSLTAAQQVRHIAHTIHWFREGVFDGLFNMDFEGAIRTMLEPVTMAQARQELDAAWDSLATAIEACPDGELDSLLPPNPLFGEIPRWQVLLGNCDHTAHHRGSLAVYLRGLGITPPMPYM